MYTALIVPSHKCFLFFVFFWGLMYCIAVIVLYLRGSGGWGCQSVSQVVGPLLLISQSGEQGLEEENKIAQQSHHLGGRVYLTQTSEGV